MECQLDQALQGTLAVLTKVEPKDLQAGPADQLAAYLGRVV